MNAENEVSLAFWPARRLRRVRQETTPAPQPARVARQLALAHSLQARIDSGEFQNQAELARALGFSRERIAKMLDLLLLAPDVQEELLFLERAGSEEPLLERDLRPVVAEQLWDLQRQAWARLGRAAGLRSHSHAPASEGPPTLT